MLYIYTETSVCVYVNTYIGEVLPVSCKPLLRSTGTQTEQHGDSDIGKISALPQILLRLYE